MADTPRPMIDDNEEDRDEIIRKLKAQIDVSNAKKLSNIHDEHTVALHMICNELSHIHDLMFAKLKFGILDQGNRPGKSEARKMEIREERMTFIKTHTELYEERLKLIARSILGCEQK